MRPNKFASDTRRTNKSVDFNGLPFAAEGIVRFTDAEKNHKIYAPDPARHPADGAADPRAALCPGHSGFHPGQGGRLCLRSSRYESLDRPHPPRLPAPADGRGDAAGRPDRYARRLRQALARRGPVAAAPERGRRPQLRTGPDCSPLQGHRGRHGDAPHRRIAVARRGPGRPPDPYGRHRPDHALRRRHLPRPDRIGPCGEIRQRLHPATLVIRHPENHH